MTKLKPGDRVNCKVKAGVIVSPYSGDNDEIKEFEIIGKDNYGYYLYIPRYFYIKGGIIADKETCNFLHIQSKYLGEQIIFIQESLVFTIVNIVDGCTCFKCKEFYHMAEPNQPDGTLICWQCRTYPHYR